MSTIEELIAETKVTHQIGTDGTCLQCGLTREQIKESRPGDRAVEAR